MSNKSSLRRAAIIDQFSYFLSLKLPHTYLTDPDYVFINVLCEHKIKKLHEILESPNLLTMRNWFCYN